MLNEQHRDPKVLTTVAPTTMEEWITITATGIIKVGTAGGRRERRSRQKVLLTKYSTRVE